MDIQIIKLNSRNPESGQERSKMPGLWRRTAQRSVPTLHILSYEQLSR